MTNETDFNDGRFLRVFIQHEAALRAYARALLPDWHAVDEAMQEASVVMWRKVDQLESTDEFLPWAKTVLRFEILKARRKHARDRHVFSNELIEMLAEEGLKEDQPFAERQRALASCLAKLSPANRELVLAPYLADRAVTEIAEQSGRTVNSLYKRMGRLRLTLRRCIEDALQPVPAEVPS